MFVFNWWMMWFKICMFVGCNSILIFGEWWMYGVFFLYVLNIIIRDFFDKNGGFVVGCGEFFRVYVFIFYFNIFIFFKFL